MERRTALREFTERGLPLVFASLRTSGVNRTNAAEYVTFLFNLDDKKVRAYVARSYCIANAREAACLCLPLPNARELLTDLRMEANLEAQLLPGWTRVCVIGGWRAYAFFHVRIDPSAPDIGRG